MLELELALALALGRRREGTETERDRDTSGRWKVRCKMCSNLSALKANQHANNVAASAED